ncbi:MAG: hypothetical protein MMC33_004814 [Icmadophila ericetorum]|nr:hypothetical protein [Icmadophila ericetorum]
MPKTSPALSAILPPLICGTGTFNSQYNPDPYTLPTTGIVHKALALGVRAFDTSPYYGPAEELLGQALDTTFVHENFPRDEYFILTKVGRIALSEFDYSASWVRQSIARSLKRLRTKYLDVVYCHDVEFVSAEEVLEAVTELRRIRDETGVVKYIGISGYPVKVLCDLADLIKSKTGEPLDAVMSYANYTLQNTRLLSEALPRLKAGEVDVVPNASVLGMGLLRRDGVPIGGQGDFHPSPEGLRSAIKKASDWCDEHGDRIEKVAIRYALESWMLEGKEVGSSGDPASGVPWKRESIDDLSVRKLGVSLMGVSNLEELEETIKVWKSILDGLEGGEQSGVNSGGESNDRIWSLARKEEIQKLAGGIKQEMGEWVDYIWPSPGPGYVNKREKSVARTPS